MIRNLAIKTLSSVFLTLIAAAAPVVTAQQPRVEAIESQEQALTKALEYAGFAKAKGFVRPSAASSVTETAFADSTTPFLSDSIAGSKRWIVTFESIFLDFGGWSKETVSNQIRKTYNFVLDPATGRLLKVYSP
jgi:hypothetical protein